MKNTLLHQAAKFKLQNRKHKRWQKAVSILACIVVFCTVYALILPALTAEGTPHCGIEEHTHTDECYENRLICGKEEGEGAHTHTDECYTQEQTLICGQEEGEGAHTHTEECYDEDGNLICGLEENEGHQHTEECYQTENILTCDQEESEGHQHTAECYERVLTCGKEEHTHTLACYSDPNADVEDADTWQNSVSSVSLTGNWGSDLAAIAQTQIGYRESTSNYNVAEDGATMNGYTRYGAWAGDPYRDNWSAQFTDFCLSYAGIPSSAMVQPSDCWEWAPVSKEGYTPNTGDLIILDGNQDGTPDHAGIVLNANDAQVTTVIGDSDKEVKQNTYNLDNAIIVGYVTMPRNPNFDYGDAEPAADDADAQEPDNNNIEETPTAEPEETPEPAQAAEEENEDDAPEALDDETSSMAATGEDGDKVDERITLNVAAKENGGEGENGQTLLVNVNSQYSSADIEGNVTIQIDVSKLPEGVTLAGFDNNQMLVEYKHGTTSQQMTVYLRTREDGTQYVEFTQSEGSTINFDLTFNSKNGVMDKSQKVTLTPKVVDQTEKDKVSNPIDLKWTGENKWSNLEKTVDHDKILVDASESPNRLIGKLNYTISAQEENADGAGDTGSIWTREVRLEDTLGLPDGISFPNDAKIDSDKKAVVDGNGDILFSFSNLDSAYIQELSISENKKSVNYKIVIPNSNLDDKGVPIKEMDGISIGATLDVSKLTLADNYASRPKADIAKDIIKNTVSIETIAYKGDDTYKATKSVEAVPDADEKIDFKKSHKTASGNTGDWAEVNPGETIKYTITIKNTGKVDLAEKDEQGNKREVVDTLPQGLVLTKEQIDALSKLGAVYDSNSRKITWAPGEVKGGETKTLEFEVNVADARTLEDLGIKDGSGISNRATFNEQDSTSTVKYKEPKVTIKKENYKINGGDIYDGQKVGNKDVITYKITLTNDNAHKSTPKTITDILQNGLVFKQMVDSQGKTLTAVDGEFNAESVIKNISSVNDHKVNLKKDGQKLTWELGELEPYETVILYLECEVDVDELGDVSTIKNNASTSSGENSGSEEIGIENPVTVDKKVKGSTDAGYNDGGGTYDYGKGNLLDYSITIENATGDKACNKDDLVLKDSLSRGLIPNYNLYTLRDSSKDFLKGQVSVVDLEQVTNLTFEQYLTKQDYWNTVYYTVINNEVVKVSRDGYYVNGIFNGLELSWYIGKLNPGEKVTKSYQGYLYRTEQEKAESGSTKPEFSNTAKINGDSDTVKVYGKVDKGNIVIRKEIQGSYGDDITKLTDEQKEKISFSLKGKTGNVIREFTLKDFYASDKIGIYEIKDLEYGTYIIEETSGTIDDGIIPEVTVKRVNETGGDIEEGRTANSYEFTIDENTVNECFSVQFINKYSAAKQADIRKDVWAITDGSGNGLSTKEEFPKKGSAKYVVYNITAVNTGKESINITEIIDDMDSNLTYVGFCPNGYNLLYSYAYSHTEYTQNENEVKYSIAPLISYTGNLRAAKIIKRSTTDNSRVEFEIQSTDGKILTLNKDEGISFFIMCTVKDNAEIDQYLTNTATLKVDSDVEYNPYGVIRTKGTPNDANQNNGDSWDAGYDDSKTYHYISSSVSVKPTDSILPGITKSATGYVGLDKDIDTIQEITDVKTNISSQSAVRWKVDLLNEGTKDIKSYTITDSVDAPFHILSEAEAKKLGADTDAKRKQYNVFTLEILNASGQRVGEIHDLSAKVWEKVKDAKQQSITIDILENEGMSIPAGGKAVFTVYTNNTTFSNKIYTNRATFSPKESFKGSDVKTGQLVTDENSDPTGVKAEANVYALGDYASFSWKTIEEDGNTSNNAVGYDEQNNYITIDGDSTNRTVIYTNNIENTSNNSFSKFVVVDLMPYSGDTGVFNQDSRGSEFKVNFINNSMNIVITDASGNIIRTLDNNEYEIKYSEKVSFDDDTINSGNLRNEWHDTWTAQDKSFAIVVSKNIELKPGQIMKMRYKGLISDEAQPGQIAWNSFGYKYTALNAQKEPIDLRAEPPKVGVMIKKKPIIEKQVINSKGETQAYDASKTFEFAVYEGESPTGDPIGKFTLCQGGSEKLENIKKVDGDPVFEDGHTYTVVETGTNGCEFVNVGIKGDTSSTENKYTFKYDSKVNKIDILFINKQLEYKLPETGGIGTNWFTAMGLLMMVGSLAGFMLRQKRKGQE